MSDSGDPPPLDGMFEHLFRECPSALMILAGPGRIVDANPAAELLTGYPRDRLIGSSPIRLGLWVDLGRRAEVMARLEEHGTLSAEAGPLRRSDGAIREVIVSAVRTPLRGAWSKPTLVILTDVSELVGEERKLRRAREALAAILDSALVAVVGMNAAGEVTYWNPRAAILFGLGREEAMGRALADLIIPERLREAHRRGLARYLGGGASRIRGKTLRMPALRRDGSEFPVDLEIVEIPGPEGKAFSAFITDVSERVDAERQLRESERRYRELFESAPVGIYESDRAGVILSANVELARILGYGTAEDLKGRRMADLYEEPAERERLISRFEDAGEVADLEVGWLRKDGRAITIQLNAKALRSSEGTIERFEGFVRDVTLRVGLEEQLRHSQKMEAVGRLAGGVAHDFNNILTTILGYCELALSVTPEGHPSQPMLSEIRRSGERAAALTQQLLAVSRRQVLRPRTVDLNAVVSEMLEMLSRLIGEDVRLEPRLAAEPRPVRVDPHQIQQVVLNLAVNARDALPRGGCIMISTAEIVITEAEAAGHEGAGPGRYQVLVVEDDGEGIPESIRKRIFEPFFTTRQPGRGTGLGLSMVYGIVQQSGGFIRMTSEVGKGTRFEILLPPSPDPLDEPALTPAPGAGRREGTVLLVEDEPSLRHLVEDLLTRAGFRVLAAGNPSQAVEISRGHRGGIDLVLSDVVMPGGTVDVMLADIRRERPGIPVLFMSGYPETAPGNLELDGPGRAFISKPFTREELLQEVSRLLPEGPAVPRG